MHLAELVLITHRKSERVERFCGFESFGCKRKYWRSILLCKDLLLDYRGEVSRMTLNLDQSLICGNHSVLCGLRVMCVCVSIIACMNGIVFL